MCVILVSPPKARPSLSTLQQCAAANPHGGGIAWVESGVVQYLKTDDIRRILDEPIPARSWELFTVHMMGTARMGSDRSHSVTDAFGYVHDTDRLMVADASLFPSAIRTNPMETIMALATRAAGHVIDNARRFLS